jgi:hypothetical protein
MSGSQDAENASTNRRDAAAVLAEYAAWLPEQPLSARTRETYLAAEHVRGVEPGRFSRRP